MRTYILKRLLIMIPTFFGISLIVFAVVNLAPGRPGATKQSSDLAASVRGEQSQESYRIFLEQFNLDKPILWNTRFALKRETVQDHLEAYAQVREATAAERIAAQETLEDLGSYSVPHLIEIARDLRQAESEKDRRLRDVAVYFLRLNGRLRLIDPYAKNPDEATRAKNREIDRENTEIRLMKYALEDPEDEKQAVIGEWLAWYEARKDRWTYTAARKLGIFLTDTRFAAYWANLLTLNFGISNATKERVVPTLISKLKYSISLSIVSILLAYLISIPIGIYSAVDKDSPTDRALTVILFMLYSLPSFFVATVLLYLFSLASPYDSMKIFPEGGWQALDHATHTTASQMQDILWHLVLPIVCLTYHSFATLSRYMRTGLLDVIRSDYIRTARAKGLSEWKVILKHAVRNGLLPILTLLASILPAVLGGSVIIEVIFGIPGMGLWVYNAILLRDYNVVMAVFLISATLTLVELLLTDILYALVDPRISFK